MEERDDERRALIQEFYQIYRPLQKIRDLRLHSHFSIYPNDDDFIEIWEYASDRRVQQIVRGKGRKRNRVLQAGDRKAESLCRESRGRRIWEKT